MLLLGLLAFRATAAQRPLNLGFESASVAYADRPWGWTLGWNVFAGGGTAAFALDSVHHMEGRRSLRVTTTDTLVDAAARSIMLQLGSGFARGRELRLTGRLRVGAGSGHALVQLEAWGDRVVAAGDTSVVTLGGPVNEWRTIDLVMRVPPDPSIHSVVVSVGLAGSGTAWFDGFAMRLDGTAIHALPTDPPAPTDAEVRWLATRASPLRRVEVTSPAADDDADLEAVARIVGKARVVGLGESTHGTREFFDVKDRIVDYLVRRHGFDVFAIEANQLAVERLDAYVQGGAGTAREAMRVMFAVWNTEEMEALIERLRAHNRAHPARPVHVVGYDMQDNRLPYDSLLAFVTRVEPAFVGRVRALGGDYGSQASFSTPQLPDERRAAWRARAESLHVEIVARRSRWLAAARTREDTARVAWAAQSANLLRQAASLNATLNSPDRDSLMAANLDWALRTLYPGSRAVAWAHDIHVAKGGEPTRAFNGGAEMGAHLRRRGVDYRAFSLLTRTGAYRATRSFSDHAWIEAAAHPAPEGSVEHALARIPRPRGAVGTIVDLRVPRDDPRAAWLWTPRPIRHIGFAAYDFGFELLAVMPLEFDGVIFVEVTTAARGLR